MRGLGCEYPAGADNDPTAPWNHKECENDDCEEVVDGDQTYCCKCDEEIG